MPRIEYYLWEERGRAAAGLLLIFERRLRKVPPP